MRSGEAEAVADAGRFALGDVPAEGGEALLELTVLADGLVGVPRRATSAINALLLLHLAQQRVEATRGEHPVLCQHVEVALVRVLRQIAELTGADDLARVGLALAREDAQRGRLAGTVTADEPDAVSGLDTQRRTGRGQKRPHTGTNFQVGGGDQADS